MKETCLEKYGCEYAGQADVVKEKVRNTWNKKTPDEVKLIREKFKSTCRERYGEDDPNKIKSVREKINTTKRISYFETFKEELRERKIEPLFSLEEYSKARHGDILKFRCLKCGRIFNHKITHGNNLSPFTIFCGNPAHKHYSRYEQEIYEWLLSLGISNVIRNKRKWDNCIKYEADLYLPDYNLIIEFNGVYFHSLLHKERLYHYNKCCYFNEKNITCIQIFESDWHANKVNILNLIKSYLNIYDFNINSYDCEIKEIDYIVYSKFVENYSLKSIINLNSDIFLGMFYKDELASCMSFDKLNDEEYSIDEFIIKNGYKIDECLKRFLNYFTVNFNESLIAYVDKRYYTNCEYFECGFIFKSYKKPNYYIVRKGRKLIPIKEIELINRITKNNKEIKPFLNTYDNNLSLYENLFNNKYFIYCDCGEDVLKFENKTENFNDYSE